MFDRILLLSPHTDDAELGAGGTIIKFINEKKKILWVVFSTAEESLPEGMERDTLEKEFINVTKKLDLHDDQYLVNHFKVRKLHEKRQEILELLIKIRNEFQPDLVIGPSLNDFHQDHIIVATEMVRAFKGTASVISYELPWNHVTFNTQLFVQLEKKHVEKKIELLQSYNSQIIKERSYFNKEFIEGFAHTRGVQIGTQFAEAFEVIRWMI